MSMKEKFSSQDEFYMKRALELAALARGRTSPNPMVGCVIVKDGRIVGEGYHHQAGTPHAEVHALAAAGSMAENATVYVSLEPCSHFGRTPPCADALVRAQVSRVVVAMVDPNPLVAGKGIQRLEQAGIAVQTGLLAEEATRLNEAFIKAITKGLPFLLYKAAFSLDGKIATATGESRWISSKQSRAYVHRLRNYYDVVMVGSETVVKDNPALTCRVSGARDPVRLIVDGKLRLPEDAQVLLVSSSAPCIIATSAAAPASKINALRQRLGVEVWQYPDERYVPLTTLMRDLNQRGWNSVLLEGGGILAGSLVKAGLVDKIEFFLAPKLIGGHGPSPLAGFHIEHLAEAPSLHRLEVSMDTGDLHVSAYLNP
ncbi:bifunctional diaminohydroxyphosphoribosylaminopyrimidine deaminase/5-amino-6-(5-phosphoribosylamino)uracil reductase RibD [Paradesulfitobacterium aromaticivorans]